MPPRYCAHCGRPIPEGKRASARFCKPACRVNHHVANKPRPTLTDEVRLNRTEAGLLIDSAAPWAVNVAGSGPDDRHPLSYMRTGGKPPQGAIVAWLAHVRSEARAKRVQRAWRRLAALGLVRVGSTYGSGYSATIIERTDTGGALLARRHNELGAIAERGNGRPAAEVAFGTRLVFWRDGREPTTVQAA
jgi:hypothetical protein